MNSNSNPPQVPEFDEENDATRELDKTNSKNQKVRWICIGAIVLLGVVAVVLAVSLSSANTKLEEADGKIKEKSETLAATEKGMTALRETCESERNECNTTKQQLEEQVAGLESALASTKTAFGELKDEKKQASKELAQFKAFSAKFKRMVSTGKLEVVFRRGRMVVNLPAQVLFDSGSAELSEEGHKALKEVAKILRKVQNKRFIVGGHTDNQKIRKSKSFKSNWELSTARALVVTEDLIAAGLKPWNLIAAGYSQYAPIASNATDVGRQKNRRIEIILEPYLKDIEPPKKKSKSQKKK